MMRISLALQKAVGDFENVVVLATEEDLHCAHKLPKLVQGFPELKALGEFKGKEGSTALACTRSGQRWLLVGLGGQKQLSATSFRRAAAAVRKELPRRGMRKTAYLLTDASEVFETVTGLALAGYRYDKLISRKANRAKSPGAVTLVLPESADKKLAQAEKRRATAHAAGCLYARDLLCAPANIATPEYLAECGEEIGERSKGRVSTRILGQKELEEGNFNALLAVARGSSKEPKVIVLEYAPLDGGDDLPLIALVGKGLTFDSGGISLKPGAGMDEMKYDMGGGAAVLGVFRSLADMNLPLRIVGLVGAVENMPDGDSYRPGDVVVSRSGVSIEVLNTDAEGRVVLADVLDYAKEWKPDLMFDLATLTGACAVALGHEAAGIMPNKKGEEFIAALRESGDQTGERVWPLPMWDEYDELIKGEFGDIKNTGGRYGGAITAGKFLQNFADHCPWVHIDIAGSAWTGKERDITPKVGNGFGVRLLLDFLEGFGGD